MSDRNQIARTVRQLPAIVNLEEMWQQREGESDEDYWAFLDWLDRGSERGAPPAKYAKAAANHEWAQRALAYERADNLQKGLNEGEKSPEAQIVDSLTRMVQIETQKLLQQAASEPGAVVSVKDLLGTIGLIADLQAKAIKAQSSKTDLSGLSKEELHKLLEAQRILRQAAGK